MPERANPLALWSSQSFNYLSGLLLLSFRVSICSCLCMCSWTVISLFLWLFLDSLAECLGVCMHPSTTQPRSAHHSPGAVATKLRSQRGYPSGSGVPSTSSSPKGTRPWAGPSPLAPHAFSSNPIVLLSWSITLKRKHQLLMKCLLSFLLIFLLYLEASCSQQLFWFPIGTFDSQHLLI